MTWSPLLFTGQPMAAVKRSLVVFTCVALLALTIFACWRWVERVRATPPFDVAVAVKDPGSLHDRLGMPRRLSEFAASRALVVAFLSSKMEPDDPAIGELARLEEEFDDAPVTIVAAYPDEKDSIDVMAAHAVACDLGCLVLKDFGGRLARSLAVDQAPTFCVLAGDGSPRYSGSAREERTGAELVKAAVDSVLAGDPVEVPWAPARGFRVGGPRTEDANIASLTPVPTYATDIAPILRRRCETCHRDSGMAPFSLGNRDQVLAHAEMIEEVIRARRMPPWDADRRVSPLANDRDLSPEERATLSAWLGGGRLVGDPAALPPPLPPQDRWLMGEPEVLIPAPRAMEIPAEGILEYQFVEIPAEGTDPIFKEDRWVRAAEVLPSNPAVTHHIIVYAFPPGATMSVENLGAVVGTFGWVPGKPFFSFPKDTALLFPKGCRLLVEMHYTPNGQVARDRPTIALSFSSGPPKYPLRVASISQVDITIPPGALHHPGRAAVECGADMLLWGVIPHMHARGKDFRLQQETRGREPEILLSVPKYNFYWQTAYWFAEPIALPKGSRLVAAGHWDNSDLNLNNPNPKEQVSFGMQTQDEMLNAWVFLTAQQPGVELANLVLLPTSEEVSSSKHAASETVESDRASGEGPSLRDFRFVEVLGSHATLEYSEDTKGLRIVPKSAAPDQAHRIMLTSPDIGVQRDAVYVVTFRARASAPRSFSLQVAQAHAPWENLGLQSDLRAGKEWNYVRLPFRARATEKQAWIAFFLGQDRAPIEIADFQFLAAPEGTTLEGALGNNWRLFAAAPGQAELRIPDPDFRVHRIDVQPAGENAKSAEPWSTRLEGPRTHLKEGTTYVLAGRARADRPRSIVAVVSQADPPSGNAGLFRKFPVIETWREFQFPFDSTADQDAVPGFFLGGSDTAVELADLSLAEAPKSPWRVVASDDALVRLERGNADGTESESTKVRFSTPAPGKPWDVQFQHASKAVEAKRTYKVRFRARAERSRPVTLTLSAREPPFENLGLYRELEWTPEWIQHAIEFTPPRDEANAVLSFGLGQDDAGIEITDPIVE